MNEWQRWFAWYPVRAYGYAEGSLWRGERLTWLRHVEWTEGYLIGKYVYRFIEDTK